MSQNEYDALIPPTPATPVGGTSNEYDALLGTIETPMRVSMMQAVQTTPDRHAEVLALSKKTLLPPRLVEENFDLIKERAGIDDNDYTRMLAETPKLADWITNASNAAVSRDDFPALGAIETILNLPRAFASSAAYGIGAGMEGVGRMLDAGARSIIPPWMPQPQKGELGPIGGFLAREGQHWQRLAETDAPPPSEQNAVTELAGGLGQLVPALAATLAGMPELAVGMFGGMGFQATYAKARAKGIPPGGVMEDLASLANAGVYGFTGEFGMAGILKKVPPSLQGNFLAWLTDKAVAGSTQGLAMALQGAISNVITKITIDHDQKITEGLLHDLSLGGAVGATARILFGIAAPSIPPAERRAMEALASKSQLEELSAQLKESHTQERSPSTMSAFIDHVTDGGKRYISPKAIVEYATEKNLDPAEVADALIVNGREKLADALPTGQDIPVPLADYARIANADHEAFFKQYSRENPNAANAEEAKQIISAAAPTPTPEEIAQQETIQANLEQLDSPEVAQAFAASAAELKPPEGATRESRIAYWRGVEERARQGIKERGTLTGERLGAGIDPFDIADVLKIGVAKIAIGVHNFADWSAEMLQEYGPKFKPYLRSVYARSVAEAIQSANISPEGVREAAASVVIDHAVDQAARESGAQPMITDMARVGWTDEQKAQYAAAIAKASIEQRDAIQEDYRKSFARTLTDAFEAKRAETEKQVIDELNADREQVAIAYLQKGRMPNGDPLHESIAVEKLDQASLEADYGKHADSPEMRALHQIDAYRKEGGANPEEVAVRLGYGSADEMVQKIIQAPKFDDAVKAETDQRMRAQYGDVLTDGTLDQKARDAVMMIDRAEIVEIEMRAALEAMKKSGEQAARDVRAISRKDARRAAEAKVARTPVKDLHPGIPYAAVERESKAGIEAFAKGDMEGVFNAATRELVNLAEYKAVRDAQQEVETITANQRSYDKPAKRSRIQKAGGGYMDQIDAIRNRFEFSRVSDKTLAGRQNIRDFIATEEAKGHELSITPAVKSEVNNKNYREMTIDELRGVDNSVRSIEKWARDDNRLLDKNQKESLDALAAEGARSTDENATRKVKEELEPRDPSVQNKRDVRAVVIAHKPLLALMRKLDGFKDGFFFDNVWRRAHESRNTEVSLGSAAAAEQRRIYEERFKGEEATVHQKTYIPAIDKSMSLAARLTLALNWGNEGNRDRVRTGGFAGFGRMTDSQVRAVLDTLEARDWKYVQAVAGHIGSYRDQIGALYKRITGAEPKWVEPTPFETKFGAMPGWYYPIAYEGRSSFRAQQNAEIGFAQNIIQSSYFRFQTDNGHIEARLAGPVDAALRADLGVVGEHLQQVIHDLSQREMLIDVGRLLKHRDVMEAIRRNHGDQYYQEIQGAFRDIASGPLPPPQWYRFISGMRSGYQMAQLAWNFTTMVRHVANITLAVPHVGVENLARAIPRWLGSATDAQYSAGWIKANSDLMAHRWNHRLEGVGAINDTIGVRRSRFAAMVRDQSVAIGLDPEIGHRIADSYLYGIHKIIQMAEIPTWIAAYRTAVDGGRDHATAVVSADNAVLDAYGGGDLLDQAGVQRSYGGKLFTTFMSFGLALNRANSEILSADRSVSRKLVDATLVNVVPAVLVGGLISWMKNKSWAEETINEIFSSTLGMFVYARELSGALRHPDYRGPSGAGLFAAPTRMIYYGAQAIVAANEQKRMTAAGRAVKEGVRLGLQFYGVPANQLEKSAEGILALMDGTTENPMALIAGPTKK